MSDKPLKGYPLVAAFRQALLLSNLRSVHYYKQINNRPHLLNITTNYQIELQR